MTTSGTLCTTLRAAWPKVIHHCQLLRVSQFGAREIRDHVRERPRSVKGSCARISFKLDNSRLGLQPCGRDGTRTFFGARNRQSSPSVEFHDPTEPLIGRRRTLIPELHDNSQLGTATPDHCTTSSQRVIWKPYGLSGAERTSQVRTLSRSTCIIAPSCSNSMLPVLVIPCRRQSPAPSVET